MSEIVIEKAIYCSRCDRETFGKMRCESCGYLKSYFTIDLNSPNVAMATWLREQL